MKNGRDTMLRAGDWIEVKGPKEIGDTLDDAGTLDGLPFMPEMLEYCGRRFRVGRVAEKACVEYPGRYWIRELAGSQVVFLEGLRCSGIDHDGCGRACLLFWKSAWLRRVSEDDPKTAVNPSESAQELRPRLKTVGGPNVYFCQSSELARSTRPLTRGRILINCFRDLHSGSRGFVEMLGLVFGPLWRKATAHLPQRRLTGVLKRTPVGTLGLKPGDLVTIKPEHEIAQTLDSRGRNRGLICDLGMTQYSGRRYRVRNRIDRMISEPSGEMKTVEGTVILDDLECLCWRVVGGCPRQEPMYWREIWLQRVGDNSNGA